MKKESPEYLRTSLAAAMTLGFYPGRFYRDARLYCLNFLLTYSEGCYANCSYCGLSREGEEEYDERSFIRVEWPKFSLAEIKERISNGVARHVERICISMITNKRSIKDTILVTEELKETEIPISLLISPTILKKEDLHGFKVAGADMLGIAVDCATEELFEEHRGKSVRGPHNWDKYWQTVKDAVDVFGKDMIGVHLIVGLGETEREMVNTIQRVRDMGGKTHLFSFYPESGSLLEKKSPCPVGQYRRIQLARYLIDNDLSTAAGMEFNDNEQLTGWGIETKEIINSGEPFRTSGCKGKTMEGACNRPFGDGPPSDIRSYPFPLNEEDVKRVKEELWN